MEIYKQEVFTFNVVDEEVAIFAAIVAKLKEDSKVKIGFAKKFTDEESTMIDQLHNSLTNEEEETV